MLYACRRGGRDKALKSQTKIKIFSLTNHAAVPLPLITKVNMLTPVTILNHDTSGPCPRKQWEVLLANVTQSIL
jgi:hypothetical protein